MKIKIFFVLAIIALIGLTGCNINPSDACMESDVSIQSEEDLPSRSIYNEYYRYSCFWYPEVTHAYIKSINPYEVILVKLEVSDSRFGPWAPIPGTPSGFRSLSYNQSYSMWFMAECARFTILAPGYSDFTYYFDYDW